MSERIDHVVMADLCLDEAAHSIGLDEFAYADIRVKAAQVHATLALVEQQRIANLIALENQRWERVRQVGNYFGPDVLRGNPESPDANADLSPWIREALEI